MPCGNSGKGQTLSPGRRPTCAQHQPLTYSPGDGETRRVRGQHGPGRPFSSATPGRPCGSLYISQGSESKSLNPSLHAKATGMTRAAWQVLSLEHKGTSFKSCLISRPNPAPTAFPISPQQLLSSPSGSGGRPR